MELLHAMDIDGRLPWELARDCGHDELASYLFCRTVRFEIGRLSTMPFQGLSWLTALQRTVQSFRGLTRRLVCVCVSAHGCERASACRLSLHASCSKLHNQRANLYSFKYTVRTVVRRSSTPCHNLHQHQQRKPRTPRKILHLPHPRPRPRGPSGSEACLLRAAASRPRASSAFATSRARE